MKAPSELFISFCTFFGSSEEAMSVDALWSFECPKRSATHWIINECAMLNIATATWAINSVK